MMQDDAYGRLDSVVDPMDGVTRYGYDLMSNLVSLTDAEGRTTSFEYDGHARVKKVTYPGGAFESVVSSLSSTPRRPSLVNLRILTPQRLTGRRLRGRQRLMSAVVSAPSTWCGMPSSFRSRRARGNRGSGTDW